MGVDAKVVEEKLEEREEEEKEVEDEEERWRRRRRRTTVIKSNNPHLAGGEKGIDKASWKYLPQSKPSCQQVHSEVVQMSRNHSQIILMWDMH